MHLRNVYVIGGLVTAAISHAGERYEGLAYARGGGSLLYSETHWLREQGAAKEHLVLYRCPDGAAFARKRLREQPSEQAPDFEFEDARYGYREGVRTSAAGREVFVQARAGVRPEVRPLPEAAGAVIDAGFDAFVRSHWAGLSSGGGVTVPFLIPSRFEFWRFRIADARDGQVDGRPVRRLRMSLSAWYGFALPKIELAYEPDGGRLVEFQGLGTIRDREGRPLDVRILFPADRRRPAPSSDSEVAALWTRPLVSRCAGGEL